MPYTFTIHTDTEQEDFTKCKHETFTYRRVIINFYLFEMFMVYEVCHKCQKLTKTQKYWKF